MFESSPNFNKSFLYTESVTKSTENNLKTVFGGGGKALA